MTTTEEDRRQAAAGEAVARGAALLDEWEPGWRERIKRDLFDIANGTQCILGQTFADRLGEYSDGYNGYDVGQDMLPMEHSSAYYGFDAGYDEVDDAVHMNYRHLGLAWEQELWPELFKPVTFADLEDLHKRVLADLGSVVGIAIKDTVPDAVRSVLRI